MSPQTMIARRPPRPNFEQRPFRVPATEVVDQQLTIVERVLASDVVRRAMIIAAIAILWEAYAHTLDNPLIVPTLSDTATTLWGDLRSGLLPMRVTTSLRTLLLGYAFGVILAALVTTLAISTRVGSDLLETLTALFNPVPAIALLPLALIWFGLGTASLVFIIVHSVLWAVALNTLAGFRAVPETLRMCGRNYGLKGMRYVVHILIPAAFPSILSGLKVGWAFAWRTLIAAELVFGVSSRSGGLGWYIFEAWAELETSRVFAGLLTIMLIGVLVDAVIFRTIEARTVQRWNMQR